MLIEHDYELRASSEIISVLIENKIKWSVQATVLNSGLAWHNNVRTIIHESGTRVNAPTHEDADLYTLTHVISGKHIVTHVPRDKISMLAVEASKLTDWNLITRMSKSYQTQIYRQVIWLLHNEKVRNYSLSNIDL